jgi:hypothetical protein
VWDRLHLGGKFSDLTIVCKARRWHVHKAIVCSRSPLFDKTVSDDPTSGDSELDLSHFEEVAVDSMISCESSHIYVSAISMGSMKQMYLVSR